MKVVRASTDHKSNTAQRRHTSHATRWSFVASGAVCALWIALVVVNRVTQGEVSPHGQHAGLLTVVLWMWALLGSMAFVLAVIGLLRSHPKGSSLFALILAGFLGVVGILSTF